MPYLNAKPQATDCAYIYAENSSGGIVRVPKASMKDALGVTDQTSDSTDTSETLAEMGKKMDKRGTAVVFGDSFFNNESVGYEFGDWLSTLGMYNTIYNYAYEGTGFGNTYAYRKGYSLYELLQDSSIRSAVAEADVIYIHLGGNDAIARTEISGLAERLDENDLQTKVESCFSTIYGLNPDVLIHYICPFTIRTMITYNLTSSGYTVADVLAQINVLQTIRRAIAKSPGNILIMERTSSEFVCETADGMHPTVAATNCAFSAIVYGNYIPKKMTEEIVLTDSNNNPYEGAWEQIATDENSGLWAPEMRLFVTPVSEDIAYNEASAKAYSGAPYSFHMQFIVSNVLVIYIVTVSGGNVNTDYGYVALST